MFPKNRINIFYRILCLICYILVLFFSNSNFTLLLLLFYYCIFALTEKSFRNIELIVITVLVLGICYLLNNYWPVRIMLIVDYVYYFIDTLYYVEEDEKLEISKKEYVRFGNSKKKKKGSNNITAIYVTVHLVLLFLAIMVG